jgi:hypothetical protein
MMTMVPGFNTDFKYRGETYHVQTEDNGVGNPVVVTLLYHKGAILASRRTPYQDLVDRPGFEQELMVLMKSQHKDIMRSLLAGAYDKNAGGSGKNPADAAAAVAVATSKPLTPPPVVPTLVASPGTTPIMSGAPLQTTAKRTAALTLDAAIRHYLDTFATTAGAAAN